VVHELLAEQLQIEADRPLCEDIKMLERDHGRMSSNDRSKNLKGGLGWTGTANPRARGADVARVTVHWRRPASAKIGRGHGRRLCSCALIEETPRLHRHHASAARFIGRRR
jgi:hypothetical protein